VDVQFTRGWTAFGRFGWRDVPSSTTRNLPLPVGRRRQRRNLRRNKQFAGGLTYSWARHVAARSALRLVAHRRAGKNPFALFAGQPPARSSLRHHRPADDPRVAAGLPTQLITGSATWAARRPTPSGSTRPCTTRRSTTRGWRAATRSRPATSSSTGPPRCRTSTRSTAATSTPASSRARPAPPPTTSTTSATSCSGCAHLTRSATSWSPTCVQNMHFLYLQDDWRVNDRLTLNLGMRYEYATPWVEEDNILSNFDPATRTMVLAKDGSLEERARRSRPIATTSARASARPTRSPRSTVLRGGYGVSYVHFHRAGGANVLPSTGRRSSTRWSCRRRGRPASAPRRKAIPWA
jgi:hypothetical protein